GPRITPMSPTTPQLRAGLIALAVSLVLHGALVAALHMTPESSVASPDAPPVQMFLVVAESETSEESESNVAIVPGPPAPIAHSVPGPAVPGVILQPIAIDPAAAGFADSTPGLGDFPQAGPGAGGPGRGMTSFCGVPARPQRVVYVIDRSASMGLNGALR